MGATIESNIRKLSRMELLYTCISKIVIYLSKNCPESIPEEPQHHSDSNDFNKVIYHHRNSDSENRMQTLLESAGKYLNTREDGAMNCTVLQNPSDKEATFRSKDSKNHRGYAANFEESIGLNGSVITDY